VIRNLERGIDRLERIRVSAGRAENLESAVTALVERTRELAPKDRGVLKADIGSEIRGGKVRVGTKKRGWFWRFVEFGTKPHTMKPRRSRGKKVLASREQVFGRRVSHPGAKPHPFVRPALDEARGTVTKRLITALKRAAREWH
jgi:HK97 gp10 family phage protein